MLREGHDGTRTDGHTLGRGHTIPIRDQGALRVDPARLELGFEEGHWHQVVDPTATRGIDRSSAAGRGDNVRMETENEIELGDGRVEAGVSGRFRPYSRPRGDRLEGIDGLCDRRVDRTHFEPATPMWQG